MNEENNLNLTSVGSEKSQISPPLEDFEPTPVLESFEAQPLEPPIVSQPAQIEQPVIEPILEPIISSKPDDETYTVNQVTEPSVSETNIASEPVMESTLETENITPEIENLSVDPMIASGLPDVNSVPAFNPEQEPKKKKGGKGKFVFLIIILLLAIGAFFAYQFVTGNPYNIYKKSITKVFSSGRNIVSQGLDTNTPITHSGNIKIDTNIEGLEDLKYHSYDYLFGVDAQNLKAEFKLGLNEKDSSLLEVFVHFIDKKLYFNSEKLYKKLILLGEYDVDLSTAQNYPTEDVLYLYNKLEVALQNMLTKEDFATQNKKITINGKKQSVKDNYVLLTSQNFGKFLGRVLNTFKTDDKALEILANITGVAKEDISSQIDLLINEQYSGEGVIRISFYTKPIFNTVVGYSIKIDDQEIFYSTFDGDKGKFVLDLDSAVITCDKNGNVTDCRLTSEDEVLGTVKITSVSVNEKKIEASMAGINIEVSTTNKKESNELSTYNFHLSINIPEAELNMKVIINGKVELNKSITDVDTAGARDASTMSESEIEQIMNKFQSILKPTALYGILENIIDSNYDSDSDSEINTLCENATCKKCSGDICECEYYDNTFTLQTITCPNPSYY